MEDIELNGLPPIVQMRTWSPSKGQLTRTESHTELMLWSWTWKAVGFTQVVLMGVQAQVGAVAKMKACASPQVATMFIIIDCGIPKCRPTFGNIPSYKKLFNCKVWPIDTTCVHILLCMRKQQTSMAKTSPVSTICRFWEVKTAVPWQSFLSPVIFHLFPPLNPVMHLF